MEVNSAIEALDLTLQRGAIFSVSEEVSVLGSIGHIFDLSRTIIKSLSRAHNKDGWIHKQIKVQGYIHAL